ncbi:MAG: hypothetical protein JWM36_6 [Hyphomicrobiales bacterium]|nr:hypothetical protein [Hyphomicrobiales bacterium]
MNKYTPADAQSDPVECSIDTNDGTPAAHESEPTAHARFMREAQEREAREQREEAERLEKQLPPLLGLEALRNLQYQLGMELIVQRTHTCRMNFLNATLAEACDAKEVELHAAAVTAIRDVCVKMIQKRNEILAIQQQLDLEKQPRTSTKRGR